MALKQPRFEVYRSADGWRWRLRARNHKIVADSGEAYANKHSCKKAAKNMMTIVGTAMVYVD